MSNSLNSTLNLTTTAAIPTTSSPINFYLLTLLPFKILLIIATVVLNFLSIITFGFIPKKRTYSNTLFLSLACSVFIVGASSMSFITIYTTMGRWPLGFVPCVFWVVNDFTSAGITLLALCLLSFHRYRNVTTPSQSSEKLGKFCVIIFALTWVAPLA